MKSNSKVVNSIKQYGIIKVVSYIYDNLENNRYSNIENKKYAKWIELNEQIEEIELQKKYKFQISPKISIIVPMYNTCERHFIELINSIKKQTYNNWELCIADGSEEEQDYIKKAIKDDSRIKYKKLSENKGIAQNSNEALKMVTGEYIALLDHDDTLAPFALYEIVKVINTNNDVEFIYSDEDKILDQNKKRIDPNFKPDFSIDTLLSYNYICHFSVFKKELIEEVGGFRKGYEGSQDYDLILRAVEKTDKIIHIPKILYHWRINEKSVAYDPKVKEYAYENGKKAIEDYLKRNNLKGSVEYGNILGTYHVNYEIENKPKISIITTNIRKQDVRKKIDSLTLKTTYENYEIIIVQNKCNDLINNDKVKIIEYDSKEINESKMFNFGVEKAKGEYILLLNENIIIDTGNWLEQMIGYFQRQDVGIVGAKISAYNKKIKNSGIILSNNEILNVNETLKEEEPGYMARNIITQNYNAVTDVILMKKKDYQELSGFDSLLSKDNKYIDLCLKVREYNKNIIMNSKIKCYSINNYSEVELKKEREIMTKRWNKYFSTNDKYSNTNLTNNLMQIRINKEKEKVQLKSNKKNIVYAICGMLITLIFFTYNVTITYDSSHYLWLSSILPGNIGFETWDVARGPIFPLFIKLCNVFSGQNQNSLLIGMFLFYIIMIIVCYGIYKNTIKYEETNTKTNKAITFILFVLLIVLNPLIFGYYHALLTEFIAITFSIVSCYLSWKLIYTDIFEERKKIIIYTLILGFFTPIAWLLKQPYVGTVLFPVVISTVISFVRMPNLKNFIQRFGIILVCLFMLIIGIKVWNIFINIGNVVIVGERTSGGMLSNVIFSGINYYDTFEDYDFDEVDEIEKCEKISYSDKEKMKNIIENNSEYKYFKVIDTKEENYTVLYSTGDAIKGGEIIKFWLGAFAKNPGRFIKNYINNYLATTSIKRIEFQNGKIIITNEIDWLDTVEINAIGTKTYAYENSNTFALSSTLEQYAIKYQCINRPIIPVNYFMKKMILPVTIFMKICYLFLPIFTIIGIIAVFKTRKEYYITYTKIIDIITILFTFSLLHILVHSMLGATIDRYSMPSMIPTFIGIYLSVYALKNRKKYRIINNKKGRKV